MLTKKEKILVQPFIERQFKKHRCKVQNAQPAVDFACPSEQPHVLIKLKKIQKERERMREIEKENQRLLQKLSQIMSTNRLENYWKEPHPRFLNRVYIRSPQVRRRAQSVPARKPSESEEFKQKALHLSRSSARCPTCSGNPTVSNPKIPEERIPFPPPRKSWNQKFLNDKTKIHRCCRNCC